MSIIFFNPRRSVTILALATISATTTLSHRAEGQTTERISLDSGGVPGNGPNEYPAIAAGGRYVVFESAATNLVPNDTNGFRDIFVRDLVTDETTRVSVASDGTQADGPSDSPVISADGRYVVFHTTSESVAGSVFAFVGPLVIHDRQTGTTTMIGIDVDGFPVGAANPTISATGQFVAFETQGRLVAFDTNAARDVYWYDVFNDNYVVASLTPAGALPNSVSSQPSISANGQFVAFQSFATDLVAGDTNGFADIFVRDITALPGVTRVNVATGGAEANAVCEAASISGDGNFVVFTSWATNLTTGDVNGFNDVFVHDRAAATTVLVSVSATEFQGTGSLGSGDPAISEDGQLVLFSSFASNLVAGDTNFWMDLFVRNRTTGDTTRVSVATGGAQGDFDSPSNTSGIGGDPGMSANGGQIVFDSFAGNLVAGDAAFTADIFLVNSDRDGDGLLDSWEDNGIPYHDGSTVQYFPLPGADPDYKDVYIEVDVDASQAFPLAARQMVIDAFAISPVTNVAFAGDGIALHILHDEAAINAGVFTRIPDGSPNAGWATEYDGLRDTHFGTIGEHGNAPLLEAKARAYRYCIITDLWTGGPIGKAERPGDDMILAFGNKNIPPTDLDKAAIFMHELGHLLGLRHGGADSINGKPNYVSCMNYVYTLPHGYSSAYWTLDYSRFELPTLDESSLVEPDGINPAEAYYANFKMPHGYDMPDGVGGFIRTPILIPLTPGNSVDWNQDGSFVNPSAVQDLNYMGPSAPFPGVKNPSPGQVLDGHDDWSNLAYVLGGSANFSDLTHVDLPEDEPSQAIIDWIEANIAAPPVACVGDIDGDGIVGINDFLAVLAQWGCAGSCSADVGGPGGVPDGVVGINDFLVVLAQWNACP